MKFATEYNNKAGDISIYRFTIKVPSEGNLIRTVFPSSVAYVGDPSSVSICREADFFGNTMEIQNCVVDTDANMIGFMIPDRIGPGDFFTYELGHLRNPFYS